MAPPTAAAARPPAWASGQGREDVAPSLQCSRLRRPGTPSAGGIEAGSITFPAAQSLVDEWVTVSEREIAAALLEGRGLVGAPVEGAAAVALAALGQLSPRLRGQTVVVVLSGGNLSDEVLKQAQELAVSKQGGKPDQ